MAKKFTDKEYAEYMLANFVLGYIDTAIFIGANLFEKYFQKKVDLKKTERFIEFKVYKSKYFSNEKYWKQDVLHCYKKMEKHEIETEIEKFTHLRNDFVHGLDDNEIINRKNEIRKFILYVYFSFHTDKPYSDAHLINPTIDDLLLQDYKIKEITERMIARLEKSNPKNIKSFYGIKHKDFENLFQMRNSLKFLQEIILQEVSQAGLKATILSPIDTTSAYIWMPFVDKEFTDHKNKHETVRDNLLMGSVSILATPLDFRIYIDFGGGDLEYRLAFQEFIIGESTTEYLKKLDKYEKIPLKIFDIRWYSFITGQKNLSEIIEKNDLKHLGSKAIEAIKENNNKEIVTSGLNRIGYILPPSEIKKDTILMLFKNIAHLYYEFLIYKFKNDPDVRFLKESQKLLIDNNIDTKSLETVNDNEFNMDIVDKYI